MELGEMFIKIGEALKEEKPLELTYAKEGEPKTVSLESDKLEFMISEEFMPYGFTEAGLLAAMEKYQNSGVGRPYFTRSPTAYQCSVCGYTSKSTGMKNGETNVKQHIGQKKNMNDDFHDEETKAIPLVRLDE